MVRRLAFPAPPPPPNGTVWQGAGLACAESGLAGGGVLLRAAMGHREGRDLTHVLRKPQTL